MRIGIDLAPLRPPYTGISNYEVWLLQALVASSARLELRGFDLFGWHAVDTPFVAERLTRANKTTAATSAAPTPWHGGLVGPAFRAVRATPVLHAAATSLRGQIFGGTVGRQRIGLFHAFVYRAPSRKVPVPVIPVVWDLSHIRHPETHPPARIRWMRQVEDACRDAPAIHTISEFSAGEIVTLWGIPRDRIHVIPPAVGPVFRGGDPAAALPLRLGLSSRGYALTVSTLEPRKNLGALVAAFAALTSTERSRMPLVVAGTRGWGDLALGDTFERLVREGSLRLAGYVTDAELAALYAHARVMLYPSLYEGFGMPVIEALALGTPVIASDAASLPEALGGAGRLVPPHDVDHWTAELRCALESDIAFAPEAVARRRATALGWSWADAAARTRGMYRAVLGPDGG